ncbi:MAG: D-alanyl-D-alanine carboxypeptidase [Fimbriimonadaceae bacterium]|nr:D-alanyl-D-alanine carboxypeptidase [Fimbriimonadaceae bacterium]
MWPLLVVTLASSFDAILAGPEMKGAVVGVVVKELGGEVVYARSPDLRVVPASNQKLLSTTFAMHVLGADRTLKTRLWKEKGRVVVDSEGDPTMTHARLLEARQRLGLKGRVAVAVRQAYRPLTPPSWEWDDLANKYAAPVTAFTVDRSSFELWGDAGRLFFVPESYGATAKWFGAPGGPKVEFDVFRQTAIVRGQWPRTKTRLDTLALHEPDRAAATVLGGGAMTLVTEVPSRGPDLVLESPPLREIVSECLVKSDNQIAEHLLLLAAGTGSYAEAAKRLKTFLTEVAGLDPNDLSPQDGSGMSRHNLVTSRALVGLLEWTARQPWGSKYREGMAAPGKGTLTNRLQGSRFQGKTGTLDMVSALSGFVTGADGKGYVVSIVMNHYGCSAAKAREVQDRLIGDLEKGTWQEDGGSLLWSRADHLAQQFHGASRDRAVRSRDDGVAPRERADRRGQSADAALAGFR